MMAYGFLPSPWRTAVRGVDPRSPARPRGGPGRRRGGAALALVALLVLSGCNGLAFGRNVAGQLGDGSTTARTEPVANAGATELGSVDAGEDHTCGIARDAGTLHCWGEADRNRLGLGIPFTDRTEPVQIGSDTDWRSVSAGGQHTCAIKVEGSLWCWGDNRSRQSSPDDPISITHPVRVDSRTDWATVSAGDVHTCAVRTSGNLFCWGHNEDGRLGTGDVERGGIRAIAGAATWRSVSASSHTCAVNDNRGSLFCWGANGSGQLGVGDTDFRRTPTRVGADVGWVEVGTGTSHSCARQLNSHAFCWGSNGVGQVGDGSGLRRLEPVRVDPAGLGDFLGLSVGGQHTCAIRDARQLWCWGSGVDGQLGNGSTAHRPTPTPVTSEEGRSVAQVSAGGHHTQVLTR